MLSAKSVKFKNSFSQDFGTAFHEFKLNQIYTDTGGTTTNTNLPPFYKVLGRVLSIKGHSHLHIQRLYIYLYYSFDIAWKIFYDAQGAEQSASNKTRNTFYFIPDISYRLWNFHFGVGFAGAFEQKVTGFTEELRFWDDYYYGRPILYIIWNQKLFAEKKRYLFFLPDSFFLKGGLNPGGGRGIKGFRYIIDGGLLFKFNYYIQLNFHYRKTGIINKTRNNDYFKWSFNYQITPKFGLEINYSRLLYGEMLHPVNSYFFSINYFLPLKNRL